MGQAIKKCIAEGVCKREDLWITSKLWNTFHAKEHVEPACRKTLEDLGLDYLDLYLVSAAAYLHSHTEALVGIAQGDAGRGPYIIVCSAEICFSSFSPPQIHFPIPLKYVPFDVRYPPEWIHDPKAADPKMYVHASSSVKVLRRAFTAS